MGTPRSFWIPNKIPQTKNMSEAHIGTKVSDSYGSNGQGLDMRTPTEVTLPLEQGRTYGDGKGIQQVIPDARSLPAFRWWCKLIITCSTFKRKKGTSVSTLDVGPWFISILEILVIFVMTVYTPQNKHGTWKWTLGKGDSYWKPSFPGSMLNLGGVFLFCTVVVWILWILADKYSHNPT